MQIISIINQKGGVGKSTTALAVGEGLAIRGYKVLFVDLDAQGNLTYTLNADTRGSLEILQHPESIKREIQHLGAMDIVASTSSLAGADAVITQTGKEYRLREALSLVNMEYDYCIIDTPPALGILTVNALTACNGCIIAAQADVYSLQGIHQLGMTLDAVRRYCNSTLQVMGILLTRFNGRSIIRRDVADMLKQTANQFDTKLYDTKIRECVSLVEAQAMRRSVYEYAPKSNAVSDYNQFLNEMLKGEQICQRKAS